MRSSSAVVPLLLAAASTVASSAIPSEADTLAVRAPETTSVMHLPFGLPDVVVKTRSDVLAVRVPETTSVTEMELATTVLPGISLGPLGSLPGPTIIVFTPKTPKPTSSSSNGQATSIVLPPPTTRSRTETSTSTSSSSVSTSSEAFSFPHFPYATYFPWITRTRKTPTSYTLDEQAIDFPVIPQTTLTGTRTTSPGLVDPTMFAVTATNSK